jgi:hypothetical protein
MLSIIMMIACSTKNKIIHSASEPIGPYHILEGGIHVDPLPTVKTLEYDYSDDPYTYENSSDGIQWRGDFPPGDKQWTSEVTKPKACDHFFVAEATEIGEVLLPTPDRPCICIYCHQLSKCY